MVSVVGDWGLLHPLHHLHVGRDVLPVSGGPLETTRGILNQWSWWRSGNDISHVANLVQCWYWNLSCGSWTSHSSSATSGHIKCARFWSRFQMLFCGHLVCVSTSTYTVSSKTVYTVILLFSRVPYHIQKNFWPFFNSPGDEDFKTHLTLLPRWKIDQVTAQNVRQTGFWKYHFDGRFCFFIEGVANFRVNYLSHF